MTRRMRSLLLSGTLAVPLICSSWIVSVGSAAEIVLDGQTFTIPDGFTIERVAGPPRVDRPIVADFDERGRLYVADSSGSSEPVQKQLAEKPHRIVRLEDTDGDGVFDRSTVYADRMMFPEGAMWHAGSLYVSAPPEIWKLTDTNDDGVADEREVWFDAKTLTGCANDLHGPYLGPDGLIYWCKGAFAQQTYERSDAAPFVTRAAHIFRWRPDRKGPIEPVMTGGMDNPVDVTFSSGGERFFTTTFLQFPAGGKRDGIIHAVYGGIWGKIHDPIFDPIHKWTDPEIMPVMTHLGPAAPAGLTRYESGVFGEQFRDNLFAACFNMRKITRHVLEPDGATFRSTDSDFLVSDNLDFHPTDVIEDADGSLLVVNTGGWYKLCCPTSQLQKEDVLGAIYRVRKIDAPKIVDPRGVAMAWSDLGPGDLTPRLDDPRRAVRLRAVEAIAEHGEAAVPALAEIVSGHRSMTARLQAVWAATRIDADAARAVIRGALDDPEENVRQTALHSISLRRDSDALSGLIKVLSGSSVPSRRVAAEALGRIGDSSAVPVLLAALEAASDDRVLTHSLTYALIEINDPEATAKGLASDHPAIRRAAMIALDQMPAGSLDANTVAPLLGSDDRAMREAASWIAGRHPEWGATLAAFFAERLQRGEMLDEEAREELASQLASLARSKAIRELISARLVETSGPAVNRDIVLRAIGRSRVDPAPESWISGVAGVLAGGDADAIRPAIAAARALPRTADDQAGTVLNAALKAVGANTNLTADLRLGALAALPEGRLGGGDPPLVGFLMDQLDPDAPISQRTLAADVLAKADLTSDQLAQLAGLLSTAGPLVAARLLPAFAKSNEEAVGRALIDALRSPVVPTGLRTEALRPVLDRFGPDLQEPAEALYQTIEEELGRQRERINELLGSIADGDIRRGQAVFNGSKGACVACHAIGYIGGQVGPDLTRIGRIRTERDLLEAIVEPSASFVQSYEPVLVATTDGRVFNGLIRGDDADGLTLATGPNEQVRIPRDAVEAMQPGTVSVMPSGLDQQLTRQELADLIAFLRACQ